MLLQRLSDYAAQQIALAPPMYQRQPVRYIIDLSADGELLGITDTADPANRNTRRGVLRLVPHVVRTSGVRAKLLADKGSYALGLPDPDSRSDRTPQEHQAFIELARECADQTGEPTVQTVARFLDELDLTKLPLPADLDREGQFAFRVDGVFPVDLPSVRAFWANRQERSDESQPMLCVVCSRVGPVASQHPVPIKGIPGGQTSGTYLISSNARAFESYGLGSVQNAPTCQTCAERYANALNALLAGQATHLRVGNLVYVFWAERDVGFSPVTLLSDPKPDEVRELVGAAWSGREGALGLDPTAFYAIALGASGGRAVVRDWIDTTVGEVQRRLARYFVLQELVEWDGAPGHPLPVWRLANATVRQGGHEEVPANVPSALLGLALGGKRLPLDLLYQAVRRNRAEQGVRRERAVLIKMVLGSREGGAETMGELNADNHDPAYLCGRLLAVLEEIQRRALGSTNATIIDKFYGTASSAPASVFGNLLDGAQAHLAKLRKDPRSQPAFRALDQRLMDVMEPLAAFPATLTLQQQGVFASATTTSVRPTARPCGSGARRATPSSTSSRRRMRPNSPRLFSTDRRRFDGARRDGGARKGSKGKWTRRRRRRPTVTPTSTPGGGTTWCSSST